MNILEVKNLRKRFGDNEVLKGIDLTLQKGEVLSIIGSSGGGKTTFLRCLNFLEKANSGEILVNGKSVEIAPFDYTTRAEVAVLIKRILEYVQ